MEPGTEGVAVRTAGKEGHRDLSVGYTVDSDNHRTDLLVLVPAADRIGLAAAGQAGLKGVGILRNRHPVHQTDLAGHVLVPAVHTAVAVGQVGEDQKVERIRPVDQVDHLQGEHTVRIGVCRR